LTVRRSMLVLPIPEGPVTSIIRFSTITLTRARLNPNILL
jgi:hypothetical protein